MKFLSKYKNALILIICAAFVLAVAFFAGGEPATKTVNTPVSTPKVKNTAIPKETATPTAKPTDEPEEKEKLPIKTAQPKKLTPTEAPVVTESPAVEEDDGELTCTMSVRCDNALGKTDNKASVLPSDGVLLREQTVVFYEGESVFNVLVREMKKNKIHLEFVNVPVYNSAYIEGIGNLYEFDCGELSGWMYKVNGYFPNYGCSQYFLKDGDIIELVYTCDLGRDVGGEYSARNGLVREDD